MITIDRKKHKNTNSLITLTIPDARISNFSANISKTPIAFNPATIDQTEEESKGPEINITKINIIWPDQEHRKKCQDHRYWQNGFFFEKNI